MFNSIKIDNDLIKQWEPKVQKMSTASFVLGMETEDIAQELRIAVIKAARGFDSDQGVAFHTYLHTIMVNTLRTLISRAKKKYIDMDSIEELLETTEDAFPSNKIQQALADPTENFLGIELQELIDQSNLSLKERNFISLRMEGLTMEEITEDLGESAYTIRSSLRNQLGPIFGINDEEEEE